VYDNNWDAAAKNLTDKMPGVQGMWSFQLLGKVAANKQHNFPDWTYNQSQWWTGVNQNLAGGGTVNPAGGGKALTDGNPDLYLMNWPADSTVAILDKWFGAGGLGYNKTWYRYWSMDNEPEIWSGTHDDVMKTQIPAEEFMQLYFKVAKAARAKYPDIKLSGPVPANEWQWYRYGSDGIPWNGKKYCWLEYFILRIAEEEKASGIKLLDVLDIHYYPSSSKPEELVQYYRVFFDRTYIYPEANGVKTVTGGWDSSQNKEYILGRCSDWLIKYMGANHTVKFGVTECGLETTNANVSASWYASTLGEFMKNGVEVFTPWSWKPGMWETIHLFSRYGFNNYIGAVSTDELNVSAYPTINSGNDSVTIFLVNRHLTETKNIQIDLKNFNIKNEPINFYTLSKLPTTETFVSHAQNALKVKQIINPQYNIDLQLEPLSVNAIVLRAAPTGIQEKVSKKTTMKVFPNPADKTLTIEVNPNNTAVLSVGLFNINGQLMGRLSEGYCTGGLHQFKYDISNYPQGIYLLKVNDGKSVYTEKIIIQH
jgi:hypothetical protein